MNQTYKGQRTLYLSNTSKIKDTLCSMADTKLIGKIHLQVNNSTTTPLKFQRQTTKANVCSDLKNGFESFAM